MSYDLYFYRRDERPLEREQLEAFFKRKIHVKVNELEDGGVEFFYENEGTGVYGGFEWRSPAQSPEDGWYETGLVFNMNFARPRFFALELMPLVKMVVDEFELFVNDMTWESPRSVDADSLIESWLQANERAVEIFREQGLSFPVMEDDKATNLWKYQHYKPTLEAGLHGQGIDLFVPNYYVFLDQQTNRCLTAAVVTEGTAQVIPLTDLIVIVREAKGAKWNVFKKYKREAVEIPYADFMQGMSAFLQPVPGAIEGLHMLTKDKLPVAQKFIREVRGADVAARKRVPYDQFVSVT